MILYATEVQSKTISRVQELPVAEVGATERSLSGLSDLVISDQEHFVVAMAECKQKSWLYFFPFLQSFSSAPNQILLWEKIDNSICVYILSSRKSVPRIRLYLPPFPFNAEALRMAEQRQRYFNNDGDCEIVWAEQSVGPELMRLGYRMDFRESEHIYGGDLVRKSSGQQFERLRRYVNRASRTTGLVNRNFQDGDQNACLELLKRWRSERILHGINVDGYGYSRRCIENAYKFKNGLLRGEVFFVDERLVAFTFGGLINPDIESIFLTISDHNFSSLGYLQRFGFMSQAASIEFFNDSSDLDLPGLEQVKSSFRAIEMNHLYRATVKRGKD